MVQLLLLVVVGVHGLGGRDGSCRGGRLLAAARATARARADADVLLVLTVLRGRGAVPRRVARRLQKTVTHTQREVRGEGTAGIRINAIDGSVTLHRRTARDGCVNQIWR